jgi:glycosyltransferase involved in cell wall biosynthesis
MKSNRSIHATKIGFVGNYLPRQCGIATFTTDLCESMAAEYPLADFIAVAMDDEGEGYDYPARVNFSIAQEDLDAYEHAAEYLNLQNLDMVSLQHEFGIFGGRAGSHILALLRKLNMPVVTTLHTILTNPNRQQREVMDELIQLSTRLVVMSQRGVDFLRDTYDVPAEKIDLIPHGIPDVPFGETGSLKKKFGLQGKNVLLTFGLLSPNKGIEYALQAMPRILEKHPDTVYVALGATHPHVKQKFGEQYRDSLKQMAADLNIGSHVIFDDRFVSHEELVDFIAGADIYITPYLNEEQIVSGTLAYTMGAGKQVISTPYWYAEELLADDRGIIVPFRNAEAIADSVINLLSNEDEGRALRRRAYIYGRNMTWPKVAEKYMESFERARTQRVKDPMVDWSIFSSEQSGANRWGSNLPPVNLRHLLRMTDTTGIFQHAVYDLPNYVEGYCTDDNARALILSLALDKLNGDFYMDTRELASRYLSFLFFAFNPSKGRFHNFLSYGRQWLDDVGSEDSHGRALWALGCTLGNASHEGLIGVAGKLFSEGLPAALELRHLRSWAFSLLGIHAYLQKFSGDRKVQAAGLKLAERLLSAYNGNRRSGWDWFEDFVSYNNSTLPQALLLMGSWLKRSDMVKAGLESLQWLLDQQTSLDGHFVPIGSNGFYAYGGQKARFDQQPIEAGAMVSACLDAFRITGERQWYEQARTAFEWFLGRNDLGLPVYDAETGGCRDGLEIDRLNQNQGAESTLTYLMALTDMYTVQALTPIEENTKHGYSLLFNRKPSSE